MGRPPPPVCQLAARLRGIGRGPRRVLKLLVALLAALGQPGLPAAQDGVVVEQAPAAPGASNPEVVFEPAPEDQETPGPAAGPAEVPPPAADGAASGLAVPDTASPDTALDERVLGLPALVASGDLQLRGRFARLELAVPVETGARVRKAALKLAYQSAPSLLSETSRLVVSMNGEALAELPLSPRRGQTRAEITLPADEVPAGGGSLTLTAWQEHREGCSLTLSRDLWTQIDPANSYLMLAVERPDDDLVLADLGEPNWPLGRTGGAVSIITSEPVETDLGLKLGGLVAQGLALRLGDRPLIVEHRVSAPADLEEGGGLTFGVDQMDLPPGNHVLIGTFDQLLATLGLEIAKGIEGPYVGVHRLGGRPTDGVLVISGLSEDDVLFAATAFANPALELPEAPTTLLDQMPPLSPSGISYLQPGRTQTLEQWAEPAAARSGQDERRMSFVLMLPPDFYVADNRKAELRVNYGYKPNVGAGSALHVVVNNEYAGLINLEDSAEGGIVDGQAVRLPLRLFRPGRNVLTFEPALTNADAVGCSQLVDGGPSVGVFGDSTLWLPTVSNVVNLPDLGLFASSGFPYGADGVEAPTSLVATSYDPSTIGATWTLLARMAQSAGAPLLGLEVGFSARTERAHVLYVGPLQTIDQRIAARTPLARLHLRRDENASFVPPLIAGEDTGRPQVETLPPPVDEGLGPVRAAYADAWPVASERAEWERQIGRPVTRPGGPFGRIAAALDEMIEGASRSVSEVLPQAWQPDLASREPGFFGDDSKQFDGAAISVLSPFAARRTATVVTAADPRMLERAVAALVQPGTWYALRGDVAAWTVERPGAAVARISGRFPLQDPPSGARQWVLYWNSYFAEHPAFWMLLVAGGILMLALITTMSIRRLAGTGG